MAVSKSYSGNLTDNLKGSIAPSLDPFKQCETLASNSSFPSGQYKLSMFAFDKLSETTKAKVQLSYPAVVTKTVRGASLKYDSALRQLEASSFEIPNAQSTIFSNNNGFRQQQDMRKVRATFPDITVSRSICTSIDGPRRLSSVDDRRFCQLVSTLTDSHNSLKSNSSVNSIIIDNSSLQKYPCKIREYTPLSPKGCQEIRRKHVGEDLFWINVTS
ncbi:unnamed protein product [Didymodactylos carnosus]|uniref:Uncharacterized protein n=1 Tax=Didymodactylos carnosus TaxID=1234261 RepID=A0A814UZV3_9BILA|nr:unnamed protein product [Didymodactylos carnosus]CAF1354520.1 unnamed protein product [Didymodactylos carnosus]CAF3942979.1 unnamed protein product [Didymodactylos carnosus]CAF4164876.1 unnamed protein product [Didymodactylos carnosus]